MLSSLRRAYRRIRFGEPITVVSGLPRSGTSMAMKMLEAGGMSVVVDGIRTADEDNPKGYYEDERVKDLGQMEDKGWLADSRGKVIKIISYLLKDLPPENNYRIVFLRRNLQEVLASQKKMLERRGETSETSDEKMVEIYENHLWRTNYLLRHAPHLESLDLDYKKVLEDPVGEAERLNSFVGGGLDVEKMVEVVDPELYRNRASGLKSAS